MTEQIFGTISALEFCVPPRQDFEDIVEELDIAFRPTGMTRRSLIWDGDDVAMIERDSMRVLLGWVPSGRADGSHVLIFGVGQSPLEMSVDIGQETCRFVKNMLLSHLESYLSFTELAQLDANRPLDSDFVDTVGDLVHRAPVASDIDLASNPVIEGVFPDKVYNNNNVMDAEHEEECSLPQRLTIYTLGATMLIYTPPVGASLLIYSTLRDFAPQKLPKITKLAA